MIPAGVNRPLHILDAACDGDAVLEASLLADRPEDVICIGPPPPLAGWRGAISGRMRAVPVSRLARNGGAALRARLAGGCVAHCWSISAARRTAQLTFARPAAMVVRLVRPPGHVRLSELSQLCRGGPMAVACATPSLASAARQAGLGAQVRVIDPPARPVQLDNDARAAQRKRLGLAVDDIAIASAGPADGFSGHKLGTWVAAILAEAGFPARMLIEQTGPDSRRGADFARQAGFAKQIILTGCEVPLGHLLAAADLALLVGREALPPATTAAAMAAGLPIVAGDIPSAGDFFANGVGALLVCPDSPADISRALLRLIEQPDLAQRLGTASRSLAAERFNPHSVVASWRDLYAKLLAEAGQVPAGTPGG